MCIAILVTQEKRLTHETIKRAASANRDGGGFAYIGANNKVVIDKGYMDVDKLIESYDRVVEAGANKHPMLMHFRIATTGKVGADNCHPFPVCRGQGNGAMIHNGWFYSGSRTAEKSDTRVLAERQRNNFTYPVLKACLRDLEHEVTTSNKMAFLFEEGKYIIVNEHVGKWDNGIWYSNSWFSPSNGTPTPLVLVPKANDSCPIPPSSGGPDI